MTYFSLFSIVQVLTLFIGPCLAYDFEASVLVDKNGNGQFKTIQSAIDFVPAGNSNWFRIVVNPGVYFEKVVIPREKEYIYLQGNGSLFTKISWGDHNSTGESNTFRVSANNFVARGITFENSYNLLQKTNIAPAVAAIIQGDKAAFYHCAFVGFQDTLCDYKGRHYYKGCYIEGAVDFIWGNGQSVFEKCNINVTARVGNLVGYITAQGRETAQESSGFVFRMSNIVGDGQAYLGRAYRAFSRVIFIQSTLSSVVYPLGWNAWLHTGDEGKLTYVEAGCSGEGSSTSRRVHWSKVDSLFDKDLTQYTTENFIDKDGWMANTHFN